MKSKKHLVDFTQMLELISDGLSLDTCLDEIGINERTYYRYTTKEQRAELRKIIRGRKPKEKLVWRKNEFIYGAF